MSNMMKSGPNPNSNQISLIDESIPDPLVRREVHERLDSCLDLPSHLDQEGLVTQEAEDSVDSVGGDPVEEEAHDLGHHLESEWEDHDIRHG